MFKETKKELTIPCVCFFIEAEKRLVVLCFLFSLTLSSVKKLKVFLMWPKKHENKASLFYYSVEDVCCPFSSLSQPWAFYARVPTICLCLKQLKHQINKNKRLH